MAHEETVSRTDFVEKLASMGVSLNTLQALFNAYTAGAKHMREQCIRELQRKERLITSVHEACDAIESVEIK